jgi:hypothetical protein
MAFQSGEYNSSVHGNLYGPVSGKRMDVTVGTSITVTYGQQAVTNLSTNPTSTGGTISFTVTVGSNSYNFSGTYTSSSNAYAGTCGEATPALKEHRGGPTATAGDWTASSTGPVPHKH